MAIFITGANGFLGSQLANHLAKFYPVTALVRQNSKTNLLKKEIQIERSDYSAESLLNILSNCTILIHCAALTKAKNFLEFEKANVDLTAKLVESVKNSPTFKQFIFISSQAVMGQSKGLTPKKEEEPLEPITHYGLSKRNAERILTNTRIPFTILRPSSVYGEGDKDFLEIFRLTKYFISPVLGIRKKYVSMIYVNDLIEIISNIVLNESTYGKTIAVSDGKAYSTLEIVNEIRNTVNKRAIRIYIPDIILLIIAALNNFLMQLTGKITIVNLQKYKELTGRYWICSNQKLMNILPNTKFTPLPDAMKKTAEWYRKVGWL